MSIYDNLKKGVRGEHAIIIIMFLIIKLVKVFRQVENSEKNWKGKDCQISNCLSNNQDVFLLLGQYLPKHTF